ncbi:MAG: type II toxin-antitoxin system HipA family toxin [Deltaproteobacteria bacterium]|nr:type II toxin-antitoxin system HipA family toxin [Deltaproteobacteria bacterium]
MGRKSKQIRLLVLLNGKRVGILARNSSGGMEFTYAEEWLRTVDAMPVSQSLPLRELPYRGAPVEAYFDNLLPDNDEIRRRITERLATAGKETVDLLAAVGRDCVGALQFVPEGDSVNRPGPIRGEEISEREIGAILRNLKMAPLGLDREGDFRISIAGAQEKTALLRWNGRWHRPKGQTPTTHILKPAMGRLPNGIDMSASVQNEWFCLKLAGHFGLTAAQADMRTFDGVDCLVVERFDRKWSEDGNHLMRIPQEDLCQALGVPWARKYESEGGPGIVTIMDFLNASDRRERDRMEFLRAQLVLFLLGAIDGHAKNFSIALLTTGFQLSPIYDVMTVLPALAERQIQPKQAKLAMAVGDHKHYRLGEIQRRHWEQTARKAGFPLSNLQSLLQDLFDRTSRIDALVDRLGKDVPPRLADAVMVGIKKHLKALGA